MRTQIFVEGFELDLSNDIDYELTYNIDDVSDFGSKNTNYSKTIVIPGTSNNNKIFNHLNELGRTLRVENLNYPYNAYQGFIASIGSQCIILVDNIQIFQGKFRVLAVSQKENSVEYECAVFGELGGFYYEINKGGNGFLKRRLQDLPLENLNHPFNLTSIQNSWTNRNTNPGVGYYYPLIDYGLASNYPAKLDFDIHTMRPAIYVKEYINRIFQAAGYTYTCNFFNTAFFKRLIVPQNNDKLYTSTNIFIRRDVVNAFNNGTYVDYPNQYIFDATNFQFLSGTHLFQYIGATVISVDYEINYTYTFTQLPYVYEIEVTAFGQTDYYGGNNVVTSGETLTGTIAGTIILNPGDTFEMAINVINANFGSFSGNITSDITVQQQSFKLQEVIYGNNTILLASAFAPQNINCSDFFTSILKMFNLYVTEDRTKSKHLNIEPYIDFYKDQNYAIDWSDKLDRTQEIRLVPMGELNSKIVKFKYKEDNDYWNELYKKKYNETYADYSWDTQYEFANEETSVELIFSPTVNYAPNGVDKVVATIYKRDSNNVETPMSSNIRILQTKNITVPTWHLKHGGNILTTTNFPYAGMWDDPTNATEILNWEVPNEVYYNYNGTSVMTGLFNAFYSQYMAEIGDANSMLLQANFKLNLTDIQLLDFSKNIIIDGSIWRVNKIDGFNPLANTTTKVELLKVIELIY
jgi:hypothetical protein